MSRNLRGYCLMTSLIVEGRCGLVGRLESLLLLLLLVLPPRQVQAILGRNVGSLTFWRVLRGFGEESAGDSLWYAWRGFCVG